MSCEHRMLRHVFSEHSVGDDVLREQVGEIALSAFTTEKPEDVEPMTISELEVSKKNIAWITKSMPEGSGRNHLLQRTIPELRAISEAGAAPAPTLRRLMRAKDAFDAQNTNARTQLGMVPGTEAFRRKDLIGWSFRGSNLAGGYFVGGTFFNVDMQDVNLNRAEISGTATNSDFRRASMVSSKVHRMEFDNCSFDKANLDKSMIRGVRLKDCRAIKLKLRNVKIDLLSLNSVTLTKSAFDGSTITGLSGEDNYFDGSSWKDVRASKWMVLDSDFKDATFDGTSFDTGIITGSNLSRTTFCGKPNTLTMRSWVWNVTIQSGPSAIIWFDGSTITGLSGEDNYFDGSSWKDVRASKWMVLDSDFKDATFDGTSFDTGIITGSNLSRTTFCGKPNTLTMRSWVWNRSNFQRASLFEITAEASQFVDTNFTDATIERCSFRPTTDDPTARCDFTQARFNAANVRETDLGKCNLSRATFAAATIGDGTRFGGAFLGGATFCDAVIEADVDFTDAIFDQTDFTGATISRDVVFTDAQRHGMIGYDTITFVDWIVDREE